MATVELLVVALESPQSETVQRKSTFEGERRSTKRFRGGSVQKADAN